MGELTAKKIDVQPNTNLRAIFLCCREAVGLLRAAGAEHRNALAVTTASISGKVGEGWLSVYRPPKHGVVGFTQAMNQELAADGIKSTALCPGFVDTPMSAFLKKPAGVQTMITPEDIAESVRYLLTTSPGCVIPEIQFLQPAHRAVPVPEG